MAKHTPGSKDEYLPAYFKALTEDTTEYILALNKAFELVNPRWNAPFEAFQLAVKYFQTPAKRYFLDQFVDRCQEELWNRTYNREMWVLKDSRKAEKAADVAVKTFLKECE